MIRLPRPCASFDQFLTYVFNRMDVEDFLTAQQLLREYETEAAEHWIGFGRRQVLLEAREPGRN